MKNKRLIGFLVLMLCAALCFTFAACNQKTLEKITLNTEAVQKSFTVGDEFTYEGLVVTAHYSDESSEVVTNGYTVGGYDMSAKGTQTVTVTYEGKTATYSITVNEAEIGCQHDYGTPVWKWTGSDDEGYTAAEAIFTCSECEDEQKVNATVTSATTDATCEDDGETVYTAKVTFNGVEYKDEKTVTISATGHDYGEPVWTWEGDDANGYTKATATFTCSECEDEKTVADDDIDVDEVQNECTKERVYSASVTFDGETYEDSKTVILEAQHTFDEGWIEEEKATCTDPGVMAHYYCSVCKKNFDQDGKTELTDLTIEALGHSYGEPTWKWTGSDDEGYTAAEATFTCSECDDEQTETATVTPVTTDATCLENGKTVYTATVTFEENDYSDEKEVTIVTTGHDLEEVEEVPATCTTPGTQAGKRCKKCDHTEGFGEIEALGHDFEDGACKNECGAEIKGATVVDFDPDMIFVYVRTVGLEKEDLAKALIIIGEKSATPVDVIDTAETGYFRLKFVGIFELIGIEEGEHAVEFSLYGVKLVPTNVGVKGPYTSNNMNYTLGTREDDGQLIIMVEAVPGTVPGEGVITESRNVEFDGNIIGLWLKVANLTKEDLLDVELWIDGVYAAKPYQVIPSGEADVYKPMFDNFYSLLGAEAGERTIEFKFGDYVCQPTTVNGGPHTANNATYAISLTDGNVVITITSLGGGNQGGGDENDPVEDREITVTELDFYAEGIWAHAKMSAEDFNYLTENGVASAKVNNQNSEIVKDGTWFNIQTWSENETTYNILWLNAKGQTIGHSTFTQEIEEEPGPTPGEVRTITITNTDFYGADFVKIYMSEDDAAFVKKYAAYVKTNDVRYGHNGNKGFLPDGPGCFQIQFAASDTTFECKWYDASDNLIATCTFSKDGGNQGGGETEEPVTYTKTRADIEQEGDKVYFVVIGTFTGSNLEKLETMLKEVYFDMQENSAAILNQDNDYSRSKQIPLTAAKVTFEDNTWKLYYDLSVLEPYAYFAHFGNGGNNDLKLEPQYAEDGKQIKIGEVTYTLINRWGGTSVLNYWGCVGVRIDDPRQPVYTTKDIDVVEEGGAAYLIIKGTSENYTKEALEAVLNAVYFDLEHNADAGAPGWNGRVSDFGRTVTVLDDGSWELKFDITRLDKSSYTGHFGGTGDNLTCEDRACDGRFAVADGKSFIIVNKNGEEGVGGDGSRFWGAIGILVNDAAMMKSIDGRLEVQESKVYFVLDIYIIGYDVQTITMGDGADVISAETQQEPIGCLYKLYFDITERAADGKTLWCHLYVNGEAFTGFHEGNIYAGSSMSVTVGDKVYNLKRGDDTYWVLQLIVNPVEG